MRHYYLRTSFIFTAYINVANGVDILHVRQDVDDLLVNVPAECAEQCAHAMGIQDSSTTILEITIAHLQQCNDPTYSERLRLDCTCQQTTIIAFESCYPCIFKRRQPDTSDEDAASQGKSATQGFITTCRLAGYNIGDAESESSVLTPSTGSGPSTTLPMPVVDYSTPSPMSPSAGPSMTTAIANNATLSLTRPEAGPSTIVPFSFSTQFVRPNPTSSPGRRGGSGFGAPENTFAVLVAATLTLMVTTMF
ncbi:hypothetical protein FA15DRAFT_756804 [Coprinopsis marcescibilis]|uniref:Uncharacterized protein n=1 Tax=Coprinopsis marcescibilis TaxID=230819 RepID=A0A5C3KV19_COPMA|nr:hypothetical protein FA15DRAFT_756804 [Coprinopsis marcescibilis]